jgi:hypothetical protein
MRYVRIAGRVVESRPVSIASAGLITASAALLGLCVGCNKSPGADEPTTVPPHTFANPQILQLRIIAGPNTDPTVCERAKAQQEKETILGRPWSADVYRDPDTRKDLSARWHGCHADFARDAITNPDYLIRKLPGNAGEEKHEILILADNFNINRADLGRINAGLDDGGRPCVYFETTEPGAKKLFTLTSRRLPTNGQHSYIAIVFDDEVVSAPRLNEAISSRGQITGNFTLDEVKNLVDLCNITHVAKPRPKPAPIAPVAFPLGTGAFFPTPTPTPTRSPVLKATPSPTSTRVSPPAFPVGS